MAIALLGTASACGVSGSVDDEPFVQVAQATSTSGHYDLAVLAHGATLTRGDSTMQYVITDAKDGSPVDGLTITIVPWMPAMGHGTSVPPTVVPLGNGTYEIDNVDLFMAGLWQLRTNVSSNAGDDVVFALQVN